MNLAWHIAKTDFRRLRLPLALWVVTIATKIATGFWLLRGGSDAVEFKDITIAGYVCVGLEIALGYLLVALLVHGDPAIGTKAFWLTRPISGGRLFIAKGAGLVAIFGVVPFLISLPWWVACHLTPRELAMAAVEMWVWHAVVVVVSLPIATLTADLARYFMWTLVTIFLTAEVFVFKLIPAITPVVGVGQDIQATRAILGLLVLVVASLTGTVAQFVARKTPRSISILLAGLLATGAVTFFWPWSLFSRPAAAATASAATVPAADLQMRFIEARITRSGKDGTRLMVRVGVEHPPESYRLESLWGQSQWIWPNGGSWGPVKPSWFQSSFGGSSQAIAHALGVKPIVVDPRWEAYQEQRNPRRPLAKEASPWLFNTTEMDADLDVPTSLAEKMKLGSSTYVLRADFELRRPVVVDEQPLLGVEVLGHGGTRTRIVSVERQKPTWAARIVQQTPSPFDVNWASQFNWWQSFAVVNRERGNLGQVSVTRYFGRTRVAGVAVEGARLEVIPPRDYVGEGKWVDQENWLEQARLVKFTDQYAGRITRELRVEKFELAPATQTGGQR
jgi:hypothetical protein